MRVLVISHLFPAEDDPLRGIFVRDQARALALTHTVRVLSGVYDRDADEESVLDGIPVRYLAVPWPSRMPSRIAPVLAARRYAAKIDRWLTRNPGTADVVHAHGGYPDGAAAVWTARKHGLPVVVTLHGDANLQLRLPLVGRMLARSLSRADRIVCVSERARADLAALQPRLAPLLVTVPNGYAADEIAYAPKPATRHLLFVGALSPVKNPEVLLRAYSRVAEEIDLPLVIAGDGPMAHWLRHYALELGIDERVRFLGNVPHDRIAPLYHAAEALVLPSAHEGMPIVVVESLATGTPVVASDVGGIREVVTDERFGRLVPPGDEGALAEALRDIAATDFDAERIAEEAPVTSWAENARRVGRMYEDAVRERKPALPVSEAAGENERKLAQ